MKVRVTSYELNGDKAVQSNLRQALQGMAFMINEQEGRTNYMMPGGKVTLSLRPQPTSTVIMTVQRTSFFEPRYVKKIVKRLGIRNGVASWAGSCVLEERVDLYLGK